ncbi:DEAD/DEAH box helicase [Pseudalkalibacillus caeni]|nr:DEAD/DEAH box helicase [Pseudalkalibacillus caeni]
MTSIQAFKPFLQEAWNKLDFKDFSEIQKQAIPKIFDKVDVIGEAPTGSGKTLAYLLPVLNDLDLDLKKAQCIILAPSRELAMQVNQVVQAFTQNTTIKSASFIGGADIKRQIKKLKEHPQVVVGTPNRILELIQMKKLKVHEVKRIVIDEADQMLEEKFFEEIEGIANATLKDRQLLFFSATLSPETVEKAKELSNNPELVNVTNDRSTRNLKHTYFVSNRGDKPDLLRKIIKSENAKALVFINNASFIPRLAERLTEKRVNAGILEGGSKKTERAATLQNFRNGKINVLLATDVAARGLDIAELTHVVQYDVPEKPEKYTHRAGRTGRMGKEGTVVTLVTPEEEKHLLKLGKELNLPLSKEKWPNHQARTTDKRKKK